MLGALISSGIDFIGGLTSSVMQKDAARAASKLQFEQEKYWAEYNSPKNQMQRLAEAGINPALAYSNGINNTYSANSTAVQPDVTDFGKSISSSGQKFYQALQMQKSIEAQTANIRLINSQADKEASQKESFDLDNSLKRNTLSNSIALSDLDVTSKRLFNESSEFTLKIRKQFEEQQKNKELHILDNNIKEQNTRLKYLDSSLQEELHNLVKQGRLLDNQSSQILASIRQINATIANLKAQNTLLHSQNIESRYRTAQTLVKLVKDYSSLNIAGFDIGHLINKFTDINDIIEFDKNGEPHIKLSEKSDVNPDDFEVDFVFPFKPSTPSIRSLNWSNYKFGKSWH